MAVAGRANQQAAAGARRRPPRVPEVGHRVGGGKAVVVRNLSAGNPGGLGGVMLVLTARDWPSPARQVLVKGAGENLGLLMTAKLFEQAHFRILRHERRRSADDGDVLETRQFLVHLQRFVGAIQLAKDAREPYQRGRLHRAIGRSRQTAICIGRLRGRVTLKFVGFRRCEERVRGLGRGGQQGIEGEDRRRYRLNRAFVEDQDQCVGRWWKRGARILDAGIQLPIDLVEQPFDGLDGAAGPVLETLPLPLLLGCALLPKHLPARPAERDRRRHRDRRQHPGRAS